MTDLFENSPPSSDPSDTVGNHPLADRMRPKKLEEIVGQSHLLGQDKILSKAILRDELFSMIFWGPPGVGKTTLARVIANETKSLFYSMSAVTSGVKDVRIILEKARMNQTRLKRRSVLFIDEIHRFNKAQQDALLHEVEDGTIYLIGATTENPSFEVIAPLLSRCRVFQLNPLEDSEIRALLQRAISEDPYFSHHEIDWDKTDIEFLIRMSSGDARIALNGFELAFALSRKKDEKHVRISREAVEETFQKRSLLYDKNADFHYDVISAFIKSLRGSDPDAGLYWLARMIEAGEDPEFIARRMIILASEDIGNADPQALVLATSAFTAVRYIGMPEARLVLAQTATYLASAPKSNASYSGFQKALEDVKKLSIKQVPMHLRNAATGLMAKLGYGEGYQYPHDFAGNYAAQDYLPEELKDQIYYEPHGNGKEKEIREHLLRLWDKRRRKTTNKPDAAD